MIQRTIKPALYLVNRILFGIPVRIYDRLFLKSFEERADDEIRLYISTHDVRKLQIGAGFNYLDGWLNTEINSAYSADERRKVVFMDATKSFPIPDGTFDCVFSEHMIEHIPLEKGQRMLAECFRILKPGGKIRITTPDLKFLIELYSDQKSPLQERYIKWAHEQFCNPSTPVVDTFVINNFFYNWGHSFIYDKKSLAFLLSSAGFINIRECRPGESEYDVFKGVESHGKTDAAHGKNIPPEFNELESLTLEAQKPPP